MRPNRHPGRCCNPSCGAWVPVGAGTLAQRPDRWDHVCSSALCRQLVYGLEPVTNPRVLRADGTIPLPHHGPDTPLLEAIATWDQSAGVWRVTSELCDRTLLLELCERMSVNTPSDWVFSYSTRLRKTIDRAVKSCNGREYQVTGSRWLALQTRAVLADDMGLGKGKELLDAFYYLDMGLLVVAPAVVKGVWLAEIEKWCPDRFDSVVVCSGWGSFRWPSHARECVIINYDLIPPQRAEFTGKSKKSPGCVTVLRHIASERERLDVPDYMEKERAEAWAKLLRLRDQGCGTVEGRKWATVKEILKNTPMIGKPQGSIKVCTVFDEAHKLKSNKALQTKRCRIVSRYSARCYGLTGTPLENDPLELWGVLTSIECRPPQWSGKEGWFRFLDAYGGRRKPHGGFAFETDDDDAIVVKPGTTEILRRVMLRRTKADVGQDLPPVTYGEIPVDITPELIARLEDLEPEILELIRSGELPEIGAYMKLRKALAASRIPAMLDVVKQYEESGTPLLVLSSHTPPVLKLAKRKGCYAITGGVSEKKRTDYVARFQAGEGTIFAGTYASMGVGITLTRAAHVLAVDQPLTPTAFAQGVKRVDRIGQTSNVHVTIMYSDHPLDSEVSKMLTRKSALFDRTLHGDYSPRG